MAYRQTLLGAQAIATPALARERILAALTLEGQYPRAAKLLGVSERQLRRLVVALGLVERVSTLVREGRPPKRYDTNVIAYSRENSANHENHDIHVIADPGESGETSSKP